MGMVVCALGDRQAGELSEGTIECGRWQRWVLRDGVCERENVQEKMMRKTVQREQRWI